MKEDFGDCEVLYDGWMKFGTLGWMEYLRYEGDQKWKVWNVPMDDGEGVEYSESVHGIGSLIDYAMERDRWLEGDEDQEVELSLELTEEERETFLLNEPSGTLGAHLNNLLTALKEQGLPDALKLAKIAAGISWIRPGEIVDAQSIGLRIREITRKAVWIRMYRKMFRVDTFYGGGLIYPPDASGNTALLLDLDERALSFDYKPRRLWLNSILMEELQEVQRSNYWQSVILNIPHSSTRIPKETRDQFLLPEKELEEEQLRLVDLHTEDLFDLRPHPMIVNTVSRIVCDPERFEDDSKEPMSSCGMGALYMKTLDGRPFRRSLSEEERQDLIRRYYTPHHREVERAVKHALFENERALIIDCHSFPSQPFPYETPADNPRPDICIGTDPFHTPASLEQTLLTYFRDLGYRVSVDFPFSGSFVPGRYYERDQGVESVMIEINRSLYMDEGTGERLPGYPELKGHLRGLRELFQEYLEG